MSTSEGRYPIGSVESPGPASSSRADTLPPPLGALFADILAARATQRKHAAQKGADPSAQVAARRESLRALEAYAAALIRRHWPVPRQIQQDIRLHRALCQLPRN